LGIVASFSLSVGQVHSLMDKLETPGGDFLTVGPILLSFGIKFHCGDRVALFGSNLGSKREHLGYQGNITRFDSFSLDERFFIYVTKVFSSPKG